MTSDAEETGVAAAKEGKDTVSSMSKTKNST
jgi:hypothetical protein